VDTVSSANFPFLSSELSIKEPIDTLEIDWYDRAPTNLEANQIDILILNLTLSALSNSITVESLSLVLIGTATWPNIVRMHLYKDEDGDGAYNDAVDSEVDSVTLNSDVIKFTFSEVIFSGTPLKLLITVDANTSVEIGKDIGLKLDSTDDITVAFPDVISSTNLPAVSALVNLYGDSTAPTVISLTLSDPSPTKAGSLTFSIEFSEDMNLLIPPVVTFGIISPFNAHALTPIGWTDARYWRGTYMINSVSGEGLNRISISNGEDLVGNPMLLDNTNTFIIDTTPPLVDPGSDVTIDEGTIVEFDGSGSQDSSGIESYEWTFSYDSTSQGLTGVSPNFTFAIPGDYKVTLTVNDLADNSGNDSMWVHVNEIVIVVPKRPRIISTTPSHGSVDVAVVDPVFIRFNLAMSTTSVANVLMISPMVSNEISWGDSNKLLRIDFPDNLDYDTIYKITIGPAEATLGTTLENAPFELKFTTEEGYEPPPPIPKITVDPSTVETTVSTGETITITGTVEGIAPGTEIVATIGDETATTKVGADGSWAITLQLPDTEGMYSLNVSAGDQSYSTELIVEPGEGDGTGDGKGEGTDNTGAAIAFIVILIIIVVVILIFLMMKKKKNAKADDDDDEPEEDNADEVPDLKKKLNQLPVQSRKPTKAHIIRGPKKN
jgi:PKD repeat protein